MVEPPPRDPRVPSEDDTVVGPVDDTVVGPPADDTYVEEEVVEEAPRKGPLIWPWLLALLLVVLGGLGAYWWFTQEDEKPVPQVIGMQQEPAVAKVDDEGFEPQVQRQESAQPAGVVFDQDPDAGTELEEGATVRLVVSSGPPKGTVPDTVGVKRDEAVEAVEAAGFDAKVTEVFSLEPVNTVVEQDPKPGETIEEGSVVELKVSKGGKPVVVPDVIGTTSALATETLRGAGFQVNLHAVPSDQPPGTVVAQSPSPGQKASQGTIVRLNVAQAPGETTPGTTAPPPPPPPPAAAKSTVPEVVGLELAEGARDFAEEGLELQVRYVPSDEPQGRIVAQARPAGTKLDPGSAVSVTVSNGPDPAPPVNVPDAVFDALPDAQDRFDEAGLEVLALDLSGAAPTGRVVSQTPPGGATIPRGSLVIVYVGE